MLSKKIINSFLILLLVAAVNVARAEGDQFYFVGAVAPLASMTQGGSGTAVYLRWDVLEGNLPNDIDTFILKRDGVEIGGDITAVGEFPVYGVKNYDQIQSLYASAENSRRKAEMSRWLTELNDAPIDFAGEIENKLTPGASEDKFWTLFASRIDFNVAVARHRGYVDKTATGSHTYELFLKNSTPQRLLGRVQVDLSAPTVLPAVAGFSQVSRYDVDLISGLGRCDSIAERFKDHGTVALTWDTAAGGANSTDRFVTTLLTAGFDIYRSAQIEVLAEGEEPPVRDIRVLAGTLNHDSDGRVEIPGLVKVNDQPIIAAANVLPDPNSPFFEPAFYQHIETFTELSEQGVKPGEQYSYYLVARDITGNYGQTTVLSVIVPDLVAPPAPWRIGMVNDPVDNNFKVTWDHVDVLSYQRSHGRNRNWCNLDTARFDKELKYVAKGEDCKTAKQRTIDLDVKDYLVYRFETTGAAAEFNDIDGDGRSDTSERLWDHDNNIITAQVYDRRVIGTACKVSEYPLTATNYLAGLPVAATAAESLSNGRKVLEFSDAMPVANAGKVFWYRVASRDADGHVSSLSEPVRALVPVQTRPTRGQLATAVLGAKHCSYNINIASTGSGVPFADDQTGDASSVLFSCLSNNYTADVNVELSQHICRQIDSECPNGQTSVSYLSDNGAVLASLGKTGLWASCPSEPKTTLVKTCDGSVDQAFPGDVIMGTAFLDLDVPANYCLKIYRHIGHLVKHYRTICGPVTEPIELDIASMGDQVCLSIAWQSHDGEVSSRYRLPCITVHDDTTALPALPTPPKVQRLVVESSSNNIVVELLPPEQPLAGTIVEWYLKGELDTSEPVRYSDYFPHAGQSAVAGIVQIDLNITSEQVGSAWDELWCVRARSVAKTRIGSASQGLSSWTSEHCETRIPAAGVAAENLPWPNIESPPVLGKLQSRYLAADRVPVVLLSQDPLAMDPVQCNFSGVKNCDADGTNGVCLPPVDASQPQSSNCAEFCPAVKSNIAGGLGFVVYRQRASDINTPATYTEYVQVSPMIDNMFCQTIYDKSGGMGTSGSGAFLFDPYIMLTNFANDVEWDGIRAVYRDHYPIIRDQNYRYQVVYFDEHGEITGHRWTDWILVD